MPAATRLRKPVGASMAPRPSGTGGWLVPAASGSRKPVGAALVAARSFGGGTACLCRARSMTALHSSFCTASSCPGDSNAPGGSGVASIGPGWIGGAGSGSSSTGSPACALGSGSAPARDDGSGEPEEGCSERNGGRSASEGLDTGALRAAAADSLCLAASMATCHSSFAVSDGCGCASAVGVVRSGVEVKGTRSVGGVDSASLRFASSMAARHSSPSGAETGRLEPPPGSAWS